MVVSLCLHFSSLDQEVLVGNVMGMLPSAGQKSPEILPEKH